MKSKRAAIKAIRCHLPAGELSNDQLAQEYGVWSAAKIFEKTGIRVRHIAAPEECASDLAVCAAEKLFASAALSKRDVDFLLFCTQSPDYFLPASACLIQDRLGLRVDCGAVDINQGCSGYVYALSMAKGLIESGTARNVLLLTGETYSKHIHSGDRSVRTLFGDGASATWVGEIESDDEPIGPFSLGTDGRGARNLIVPAGGFRTPLSSESERVQQDPDGNLRTARNLYMNGGEIFTFTLKTIPPLVKQVLAKARLEMQDVDYFVFHQANRFMLEQLRKKLGIPAERFCINLEDYGNTVSATIPMALEIAFEREDVHVGSRVMAVGFGVGYSWAACLLRIV